MKSKTYENNHKIGIMNGRLSPPVDNLLQQFPINNWKKEFSNASKLKFDFIEWIFDLQPNPILDDTGIRTIKKFCKKYNVGIYSICANYFMIKKIFNENNDKIRKNLCTLKKLIKNSSKLGIKIIVIPLLEDSSIRLKKHEVEFEKNIKKILPYAVENQIVIALETDLNYKRVLDLMKRLGNNIKINYDVGNNVAYGHNIRKELKNLMPWIISIHIKDRKLKSYSMPLGKGDVDFDMFFSCLLEFNYKHDFVIEAAQEDLDFRQKNPLVTCKKYNLFVRRYVKKYL